mgnify:CR=1 FL=1
MISKLHYITQDIPGFSHQQLTELACKGGVNWVQLRLKNKSQEEWLLIAQETKLICLKYGAQLIINDSIEIAKTVGAAGVHLGKEDVSPAEAREILGNKIIIGGSCNTIEDVERNIQAGCDYVGIGPYRFTSTKDKLNPILGLEGIREIAKKYGDKINAISRREKEVRVEYQLVAIPTFCLYNFNFR